MPKLSNIILCHLGARMIAADVARRRNIRANVAISSLSFAVLHVVLFGANKKMVWVHALWVIALVQNILPITQWAVVVNP